MIVEIGSAYGLGRTVYRHQFVKPYRRVDAARSKEWHMTLVRCNHRAEREREGERIDCTCLVPVASPIYSTKKPDVPVRAYRTTYVQAASSETQARTQAQFPLLTFTVKLPSTARLLHLLQQLTKIRRIAFHVLVSSLRPLFRTVSSRL